MNILYINSCARKNSRTNYLAKYLLEKFENEHIEEVNLELESITPLNSEKLSLRDELIANQEFNHPMFKYAKQFAKADIIIISAPYWDLSFPAVLKTYIENINVLGITFKYSQDGFPISLCNAQRLIYITTAGGPIISDDFGFGYIKTLGEAFYGIKKIDYIKAENLDIAETNAEKILNKALNDIDKILI